MNPQKKQAVIIGILFLIALILNPVASGIMNPILDKEDYLTKAYPMRNMIVIGNLLNIICAIAMIFIPIVLFSVISKPRKPLAISYIVFRGLEGILFIYIAIKTFCFIDLSKEYLINTNAVYISFGNALHSEIHWATVVYLIVFCCGAFVFYFLLFRSELVPKWLSYWGIGATLLLAAGTIMGLLRLGIFETIPLLQGMVYFAPPIALLEFILSCWIIVKGFNIPRLKSQREIL